MKGAFELGLVFLFGMMFVVMGMSFSKVILMHNQARMKAETVLSIIEYQNRYDATVQTLIDESPIQCMACTVRITHDAASTQRYTIRVEYPVDVPLLNFFRFAEIVVISRPMSRS
jgi:hypothetical protein